MQKVILVLLVVALGAVGVPKGLQQYHLMQAGHAPAVATAATAHAAPPKPAATPTAEQQKQAAARQAERQAVESALGSMKVSSLMLGDPAVCIINKNDYSVGDTLELPGRRKVQVASIREDGVGLTCNGQSYHLNAPAAPDLAALRKAR